MSGLGFALPFTFDEPAWLWICLAIPLLVLGALPALRGLDVGRRMSAVTVRGLVVLLAAFCLAGVERVQRNDDLTVMFLMDRSYSVQSLQTYEEEYLQQATKKMPPGDYVGLIDFARYAYLQQKPMRGGYVIAPGRLPVMPHTDRTDIASAIRLSMAMLPHDTAKRLVLLSDGNDNMGDLLAEAKRAKADGIPIDVIPLWYEHRNEVYFDRFLAPTHAERGEQVPLRMVISTHKPASGSIALYCNGQLVEMPAEQAHVELRPGDNTFFVKVPIRSATTQVYEAVFRPDGQSMDTNPLNNSARAFTFVSDASRALLVSTNTAYDQVLADALRDENVNVELKTPDELGDFGLPEMMSYSTIMLANVPAATFTEEQQKALAVYVKDMGSGLIMLGGDEGFGAGGWIGTPVEEVMPVSFEIKQKRVIPRGALVLIMHSCEIPRGNYWAKEMAKKSVETISSQDYIGVIAFTYSPPGENWEVPLDLNTNKQAVKARIDRLQVGDMPDFGAPMKMAYNELVLGRGRDAAQRHVIILSDGDAAAPSTQLVADFERQKITVSTIGIGWGAHVMEKTLRDIAQRTGGQYYAARDPQQLPRIFTKEAKVVRRPLIVEEPFKPRVAQPDSELLGGVNASEGVPPLGGLVLTSVKPSPHVLMPLVRVTSDGDDPVLAYWQYELGKTAAFTSGYWPSWGRQWTSWPKFAKLWAQIVRWTMRQDLPANFDTYTKIEGNRGRIVIDALDKDAGYLNNLTQRTRVIGPDNEVIPVRFAQTGPGKYEAEFEVAQAGQYLAHVQMFDGGKSLGTLRTGLTVPFSPEYRDLKSNEALLRQVVDITGGRWLEGEPRAAVIFSHDLPPSESKRPAWDWVLAWLLLPMFLLDVAVRRLASRLALSVAVELVILVVMLFGMGVRYAPWWGILGAFLFAELVGWTIRYRYLSPLLDYLTHGVTALGEAGERSAASLDQLKTQRERMREGRTERSADAEEVQSGGEFGVIPRTTAGRRAGDHDAQGDRAPGDLNEALGGADAPSDKSRAAPPKGGSDTADEATTARLLRAKRRAKREKNE